MLPKSIYNFAPAYASIYLDFVQSPNLIAELEDAKDKTTSLFAEIPESKGDFAYAPGKWSIKAVLQHINDCERIFAYRALRFARKDATPLAGFDEDEFMLHVDGRQRSIQSLVNEYLAIRQATVSLYQHLPDDALDFVGHANETLYTARSLGFMIVGHNLHHINVIKERYL